MPFVEITGTNFQNKGAELMLAAITEKCHRDSDLQCVVQPWNGSFEKRSRLGLFQKADYQRFRIQWSPLASAIPQRVRLRYGVVLETELHAVLDASGFQFGDQWGSKICHAAATRFRKAKQKGKKIVLLPQAFGPFESTHTRDAMRAILESSDLVFARDESSLTYLTQLNTNSSVVRLAPDFTNLIEVPDCRDQRRLGVCILPNQRMLDKSGSATSANYLSFLVNVARLLQSKGHDPFFLIHETTTDRAVVDLVNGELEKSIPLREESDVFRIKQILGSCRLIVGSRFHGLVSALSQGVPCIATGWSHKYLHLMRDYGCEDYFVDLSIGNHAGWVAELLTDDRLAACKQRVASVATELKRKSQSMWTEVFTVLGATVRSHASEPGSPHSSTHILSYRA